MALGAKPQCTATSHLIATKQPANNLISSGIGHCRFTAVDRSPRKVDKTIKTGTGI